MRHVFVETNWVVDYAAPAHHKVPAACTLLERASQGDLLLYVPCICLTEARDAILRKFQPKTEADAIRSFLRWAKQTRAVTPEQDSSARRVVEMFEQKVRKELQQLDQNLNSLKARSGVKVFPLSTQMLERACVLSSTDVYLKPFDQAILAAILVRAEELFDNGAEDIVFCERDADLQPWTKDGAMKQSLTQLYDSAHVWVYEDYEMSAPVERPEGWH